LSSSGSKVMSRPPSRMLGGSWNGGSAASRGGRA
jgi:hypothetical protein